MKRMFAAFAVLLVIAVSTAACTVYEAPPPRVVAYAPGYYGHPPYYYGERHYHRW